MTVICMATKLNDSLERSFAEPAFQALPVGNFRDAYAGQKICQHELGIFPDRFLRANCAKRAVIRARSEEHTSELQSRRDLVCRLLLEKKKKQKKTLRRTQTKQ